MQKAIRMETYVICLWVIYSTNAMSDLHLSVFRKNLPKLKELIENNEIEDINSASYMAAPPIIMATQNGDTEFIELLIKAGAQVDTCDRSGRTALSLAVTMERIPVIYALLLAGANPELKIGEKTPLQEAKNEVIRTILQSRPEARKEIYILCQATHTRLGADSPATETPEPAFDLIFQYLRLKQDQPAQKVD